MWDSSAGYSQETILKDTLYTNDSGMESPVYYGARDSIYADIRAKQLHLYGDARVDNGEIEEAILFVIKSSF